jgi:hypothetical protein
VSFRIELFVEDMDASIRCYEQALGFTLERREPDYAMATPYSASGRSQSSSTRPFGVSRMPATRSRSLCSGATGPARLRVADPDGCYVRVTTQCA